MSDENEVRKRKPSQEEITEKPTKTIIDEPVHSVSLISLVLKLFLGIAIVVLSLFIRGDFNDDGAGDKMTKKADDNDFIHLFQKIITFDTPQGVNAKCSPEYWVQKNKWNNDFGHEKRGKCLGMFCGRLVIDDICDAGVMHQFGHPIKAMLTDIGRPEDYSTEWDLYFNTLTNPDFWEVDQAESDAYEILKNAKIIKERYADSGKGEEEIVASLSEKEKEIMTKNESIEKRIVRHDQHGSAIRQYHQAKDKLNYGSTTIWSMELYYTQFTDIMTKIPQMIINNFKSHDFVVTYPIKFMKHSAVPEDHIPEYAKPFLVGQGYSGTKKTAKYPYVDFFAIIFIIDEDQEIEGGEIVMKDVATGKISTIEPKTNRVVLATAGSENIVQFKPVTKGEIVYYWISFTCDNRRNVAEPAQGAKPTETHEVYLPYGPLRVPSEGVTDIFVNQESGTQYGTNDPRKINSDGEKVLDEPLDNEFNKDMEKARKDKLKEFKDAANRAKKAAEDIKQKEVE